MNGLASTCVTFVKLPPSTPHLTMCSGKNILLRIIILHNLPLQTKKSLKNLHIRKICCNFVPEIEISCSGSKPVCSRKGFL